MIPYEIVGPLRPRPIDQLAPSPRGIPDTDLPICRSRIGRYGTSVNSSDFSISANRPLTSSTGRR